MHHYDVTLKSLLQGSAVELFRQLGTGQVTRWLPTELPEVKSLRPDLLGELADESLLHLELQSLNESAISLRMLEYLTAIWRKYGRIPTQMLLYIGSEPLRMASGCRTEALQFRYGLVDIRDLDGEQLLASDGIGDNIVAVLARLRDSRQAVKEILHRISKLGAEEQRVGLRQLAWLAGLRDLGGVVLELGAKMPITIDILKHDLLGPAYREGEAKGKAEGNAAGIRKMVTLILRDRFGALPEWVETRLTGLPETEVERIGIQAPRASSLDQLFAER